MRDNRNIGDVGEYTLPGGLRLHVFSNSVSIRAASGRTLARQEFTDDSLGLSTTPKYDPAVDLSSIRISRAEAERNATR